MRNGYCQQLLLHGLLVLHRALGGTTAVLLKALEGVHEIVLHEVLVKDTDQALLLQGNRVHGQVLGLRVLGVDGGQFVGGAHLGHPPALVLFLFRSLHHNLFIC